MELAKRIIWHVIKRGDCKQKLNAKFACWKSNKLILPTAYSNNEQIWADFEQNELNNYFLQWRRSEAQ